MQNIGDNLMLVYRKVIYYIMLEPHSKRAYHAAELSFVFKKKLIKKHSSVIFMFQYH